MTDEKTAPPVRPGAYSGTSMDAIEADARNQAMPVHTYYDERVKRPTLNEGKVGL